MLIIDFEKISLDPLKKREIEREREREKERERERKKEKEREVREK